MINNNNNNNKEVLMTNEVKFINYVTKQSYTGENVDKLYLSGFNKEPINEFITFNQCIKIGGNVPKGTKACAFLLRYLPQDETLSDKPVIKRFAVFHVSQVELPKLKINEEDIK